MLFWCHEPGHKVFTNTKIKPGNLLTLLPLFIYFLLPIAGHAADWSLNPGIEAMSEYNDNILFSHRNKLDDFIARIKPRLQILGRTETTLFSLDSIVAGEKYLDNGRLDTVNTYNNLLYRHSWNPKFLTSLKANFIKDETLEEELEAAGRPGVRNTRYRYGFDASGQYNLSNTFSVTLGGGPQFNNYPEGPYSDLISWQVYLDPAFALDPINTVGLFINYNYADYKDSSTVKTVSSSLYYRRELSETAYFVLGGGYRYTWTRYKSWYLNYYFNPNTGQIIAVPAGEKRTSGDGGFIFNFELDNSWTDRFSTVATAGREHYNSVEARSTDLTYARVTFRYRLTETVSTSLRLSYDTTDETGPWSVDHNNIRFEPFLKWRISPNLSLKLGGSYRYDREDTKHSNYDIQRYRGWLSISYRYPRLFSNH